ncbi:MAG: hypothetical protein K9I85_14805 [Saprospiraceae bacterium]|nr:hypothetical protein [Saprospiraceae bacterium]
MKKYIFILFALQILATSSPTGQGMQTIVKMGALLHHFIHHICSQQENIGILGFVQLHYSDHEHHEKDHAEHENLPFQHDHHNQLTQLLQSPFLLPPPMHGMAIQIGDITSNSLIPNSQQWLSSSFLGDIWQPPKV